jgi:hypothetical protein
MLVRTELCKHEAPKTNAPSSNHRVVCHHPDQVGQKVRKFDDNRIPALL